LKNITVKIPRTKHRSFAAASLANRRAGVILDKKRKQKYQKLRAKITEIE
jgi:hypothetical protein